MVQCSCFVKTLKRDLCSEEYHILEQTARGMSTMSDWLQNSYLFGPKYSVCLLIAVGSGMLPSKMFSGKKSGSQHFHAETN